MNAARCKTVVTAVTAAPTLGAGVDVVFNLCDPPRACSSRCDKPIAIPYHPQGFAYAQTLATIWR